MRAVSLSYPSRGVDPQIEMSKTRFAHIFDRCAWLPALFPGLVYRLFRPRVTALVFVSGKQMLLGVQHPDHLEPALDHLVPILRQHQYHGTQANADRKSILRQAERTLQAKLRQQAQLSVLPMNPEDTKRWEAAQKAHKRQMNKAIKLASKRNDINSLQEMRTAIQAEYETIHRKEERKEARKRSRKEESDGEDDDDDALMMDDGEEQQPPQSVMSIVAAAGGDVQDMPELLENTLLARLIN